MKSKKDITRIYYNANGTVMYCRKLINNKTQKEIIFYDKNGFKAYSEYYDLTTGDYITTIYYDNDSLKG